MIQRSKCTSDEVVCVAEREIVSLCVCVCVCVCLRERESERESERERECVCVCVTLKPKPLRKQAADHRAEESKKSKITHERRAAEVCV